MKTKQNKVRPVGLSEVSFKSEVLGGKQPVLVAFMAPWSRLCQILDWELDEVAVAFAGRAKVVKINADDYPGLSLRYEVQSIPTLLFFVEGIIQARLVGITSRQAILERLNAVLPRRDGESPASCAKEEHEPLSL